MSEREALSHDSTIKFGLVIALVLLAAPAVAAYHALDLRLQRVEDEKERLLKALEQINAKLDQLIPITPPFRRPR